MKIATIIFTYNRSRHTKQVLEALRKNDVLPERLFLFQDGLKEERDREEWEKVNALIHAIDWCENQVFEREQNQGLAQSVIFGINSVMEEYDAAIVLEDDCVPHPKFMKFVTDALKKYKDCPKVYQVSGYVWPTETVENGTDAYFTGRASSWGWATWKDRWSEYKQDYTILSRIKKNEVSNRQFHIWGEDLEGFLLGNVYGQLNSWLVFWALLIIEKGGYCLNPYESLIDNIGYDGTGVHCGVAELGTKLRPDDNMDDFVFPDKIEFPEDYEYSYRNHFKWVMWEEKIGCYYKILLQWTALLQDGKSLFDYFLQEKITKIAIWGCGSLCELLLKELRGKVDITAMIESNPQRESFCGIPVMDVDFLPIQTQLIIVIPAYDFRKIQNIAEHKTNCRLIGLDELIAEVFERDGR